MLKYFSKNEFEIMCKLNFIVDDSYDVNQEHINEMTYQIAKYNNTKKHLKIDFALTNKCNFCCPYCFERTELNNIFNCCNNEILYSTSKKILQYIENRAKHGLASFEIVFYGGEPTIEKEFIIDFIQKLKKLSINYNIRFSYIFITNGYLFDDNLINHLDPNCCKFIQITLDGEKELHNQRRTNKNKINTFDKIVNNINLLCYHNFHTVIRLNVDKSNYESMKLLLENMNKYFDEKYYGEYLAIDIARVFGSVNSYDLYHYENNREILVDIATKQKLINHRLGCKPLTTFCIAEGLTNDIVIDFKGDLYRCWNNVFNLDYKIGNISDLMEKDYDPFETSNITLEYVNKLSLSNVNNGRCFSCKYINIVRDYVQT